MLLQEVTGDSVVPNFASAYFAQLAGLPQITSDTPEAERVHAFPFPAWTKFSPGSHGVLLTPDNPATPAADADLLAATAAMRTQLITYLGSFLQSAGATIQIVVQP